MTPPTGAAPLKVETVQLPTAPLETPNQPDAPILGGSPDGGYEAAKAAAEASAKPEAAKAAPQPEPVKVEAKRVDPSPQAHGLPPLPPEKTLLMLTNLATVMSCRVYAARLKVEWTDELKAALEFTKEEQKQLETYAPYAAPVMGAMLEKYGMYIGAGIYGFVFWGVLVDRFAAIKERAPKKPEPKKEEKKQ